MTGTQAIEIIQSISWRGSKPGRERTLALLEAMGRPDRKLKCVHLAGTNGKGSTASMLACVLQKAGYRVGMFTSPPSLAGGKQGGSRGTPWQGPLCLRWWSGGLAGSESASHDQPS